MLFHSKSRRCDFSTLQSQTHSQSTSEVFDPSFMEEVCQLDETEKRDKLLSMGTPKTEDEEVEMIPASLVHFFIASVLTRWLRHRRRQ